MIWVEKYAGTPFTLEQVDQIGVLLGLPGHDAAQIAAARISGLIQVCIHTERVRLPTPNARVAKRRVGRIAVLAGQLAHLLEHEPLGDRFLLDLDSKLEPRSEGSGIDMSLRLQENRRNFQGLIDHLRRVRSGADSILKDDGGFRAAYGLPPAHRAGQSTLAWLLWPGLFDLWWQVGKRPTLTDKGPLHRFVALVHVAIGEEEPSGSTLKDAVLAWRQDERKAWTASDQTCRSKDTD